MLNTKLIICLALFLLIALVKSSKDWSSDESPDKWNSYSRNKIKEMLERSLNRNLAKNLILYLGFKLA